MKTAALMLAAVGASFALSACSARYAILTVPAISMTQSSFASKSAPGPHVDATYCSGDTPIVSHDNNVGLIDEAVMKAQQQSGAAYLSDVTLYVDGKCMSVEGTAMK